MLWHYVKNGQKADPIEEDALRKLVNDGTIPADTLVWSAGMGDWVPFEQALGIVPAETEDGPGTAVCGECGRAFPTSEMITHSGVMICAACKPAFIQKISEGAATTMVEYAGFWIRFVAKFIDAIIMWVVNNVIAMVGRILMFSVMTPDDPSQAILITIALSIVQICIGAGYTIFFLGKFGATPGKMACGLKVIRSDRSSISYGRACGRHFAEWLSSMILMIGYIMAAFDEEKRTLHDRICDTRVVKK